MQTRDLESMSSARYHNDNLKPNGERGSKFKMRFGYKLVLGP